MSKARFGIDALRRLVGETTFSRGHEYHRAGYVEILSFGPKRVVAEVAGTENYRTVLTGRGEDRGDCSCPAFTDRGFCKHMVAAAFAANAAGDGATDEAAGALSRISEHLKAKGAGELVNMILDWPKSIRNYSASSIWTLPSYEPMTTPWKSACRRRSTERRGREPMWIISRLDIGGRGWRACSTPLPNSRPGSAPTSRSNWSDMRSTASREPSRQ